MDPISPFLQFPPAVAGVVICTGLFIWNTLELRGYGKLKESIKELTEELGKQRSLNFRILEDQRKDMGAMAQQVATLAANQLNLTHSVNEVVRELIGIIREVEKS